MMGYCDIDDNPFGNGRTNDPLVLDAKNIDGVEFYEMETGCVVTVSLAGYDPEDVEVTLEGNNLKVTAKRNRCKMKWYEMPHINEISKLEIDSKIMTKVIPLPFTKYGVENFDIEANMTNGLLEVSFQRKFNPKANEPIKIEIGS